MGWTFTWLVTTNSIRARPTPSAGSRHQRNAAAGLARFSMILVWVVGRVVTSSSSTSTSAVPS